MRRSAREWFVRALLSIAVGVIGYVGASRSLALALREADPARAAALAPEDGRVTAALAHRLSGPDATRADRDRAITLARRALDQDATVALAASTLALDLQISGKLTEGRRLFGFAEQLSRRDLGTQLSDIEDAVARGKIDEAVRHYDIALRTSSRAPELLFPVLGAAMSEEAVRTELAATLGRRPNWGPEFVDWVATNGRDPMASAKLFARLSLMRVSIPDNARASVINALVLQNKPMAAWSYYQSFRLHVDRVKSRDPGFTSTNLSPTLFDWSPINEGGVSVAIQRADRGGVVLFTTAASVGGPLLRQLQLAPSGNYRLRARGVLDQADGAAPYWSFTCRDGRVLGRVEAAGGMRDALRYDGVLVVPADCPVQVLELVARPVEVVVGSAGRIDYAELVAISERNGS